MPEPRDDSGKNARDDRFTEIVARYVKLSAIPVIISDSAAVTRICISSAWIAMRIAIAFIIKRRMRNRRITGFRCRSDSLTFV